MILRRTLPTVFAGLFALAGLGAGPCTAAAQSGSRSGPTPPRLRFIDGAVSFWRTGAADWSTAQVNTALAAGDSLYAGDGANLEIQIGPQAFIRAGAATEVDLTSLSSDYMQFRITGGHAAFDLKNVPRGQTIEVDTPNAALTLNRPGYYRIDVEESQTAFSARRGGTATVVPAVGETTNVADNQQIILDGTDQVQVTVNAAPAPDAWDRWNDDRTAQLGEAPRSAQYVPPQIAGADDLDRYGDWSEQPQYGHVWVPRGVRPQLGALQYGPVGVRSVLPVDLGRRCAMGLGPVSLRPLGELQRGLGLGPRSGGSGAGLLARVGGVLRSSRHRGIRRRRSPLRELGCARLR